MSSQRFTIQVPAEFARIFQDIGEHLAHRSRFTLPEPLQRQVDFLLDEYEKHGEYKVDSGADFFRARIHGVGQSDTFPVQVMGAPPERLASAGRINPEGISFLYVADTPETAVSELRPWRGAHVTVGKLSLARPARLTTVNLDELGSPPNMNSLMTRVLFVDRYFSAPAHRDDKFAYLASQYLSEQIRIRLGCDGLRYKSVLHDGGWNYCFFSPDICEVQSVKKYEISSIDYGFKVAG